MVNIRVGDSNPPPDLGRGINIDGRDSRRIKDFIKEEGRGQVVALRSLTPTLMLRRLWGSAQGFKCEWRLGGGGGLNIQLSCLTVVFLREQL